MLKLVNVGKIYNTEGSLAVGIRKVNLELRKGEFVAITGESGSGKTTLLNILSGIDSYEEGEMYVNGEETSYFGVEELEEYRNNYVGFIFQNYNIIDSFTVYQNIEASLMFQDMDSETRKKRTLELIDRVGLNKVKNSKASKLSGGEKQRVVIARALAKDAPIIAADEPTGNLDSKTSEEIINLLYEVSKEKLVLIVTHDFNEVKDYATRILRVYDGEIKEDRVLKDDKELGDLPSLENKNNKITFKDTYKLGFMDLFGSPKRMIFHSLIFLLLSFVMMLLFTSYRAITDFGAFDYNGFYNTDNRRIVIKHHDNSAFTASEIESFKNNKDVLFVNEYDILSDTQFSAFTEINDGYYSIYNYYNRASNISENDLSCGRLPSSDGEVVVTYSKRDFYDDETLDIFLDKTIETYDYSYNSNYSKVFKIVGVIDESTLSSKESSYAYLTENDYMDMYRKKCMENYSSLNVYGIDGEGFTEEYGYFSIEINDSLSDTEIGLNDGYFDFFEASTLNINLSNRYTSKEINNLTKVNLGESDDYFFRYNVFINQNNYNKLMEIHNDVYQISLFLNNPNFTELFAKTNLNSSKYQYVIVSKTKTEGIFDTLNVIIEVFYLIGFVQFVVGAFFLVYVILLHSMKAKKEDVQILRTIGATKSNIRMMLIAELSSTAIISFIVNVIIYIFLLSFTKGDAKVFFMGVRTVDFIISFFTVTGISVLLSLFYSRTTFKSTVKKELTKK